MTINSKLKLFAIVMAPLSPIIIALIQFQPWRNEDNTNKNSKIENTFSGTVVDESNNNSISQAEISIVGNNEQYISESNGNFNIPFPTTKTKVRVRVTKRGFIPFDHTYDLPANQVIPLSHSSK